MGDENLHSFTSLGHTRGICFLRLQESQSPCRLEAQFQLVNDRLEPAVIQVVNEVL